MNNPLLWLIGFLLFLWLLLGSFLSNRFCNCSGAAAIPPVVAPAVGEGKPAKSILISDPAKNFKISAQDNLLFPPSKCNYLEPISAPLTAVFQQTADYLAANAGRILVLTGLRQSNEKNECADFKDLGVARAEKVRALLVGMGAPAAQIRVQSEQGDVALFDGNVLGGVRYEFLGGETAEVEKRLRVGNITLYFESNQREINLTPEQQQYFDDLKTYLAQKPNAKISVTGHTDDRSNLKYNLRLSRKRAEFVRDFMAQNGIPVKNIEAVGKGPNEPVATNDTEDGRAKNRRVEVKIQ